MHPTNFFRHLFLSPQSAAVPLEGTCSGVGRLGYLAVLLFLATVLATGAAATAECPAWLEVVDRQGAAIEGATARAEGLPRVLHTDGQGRACLDAWLSTPSWMLVLAADGFSDRRIQVQAGELGSVLRVELLPVFDEELDVTSERLARRLREVPTHIRTLSREQIENTAARTLAEAMEWTPGVRLESNCQNCNTSQVRLLGLEGPYTQILVGGQPTVSSLALVYGLEQIPARLVDGLEVVKGGGAAVYGAGAVGGVIDLIPHQPMPGAAAVELRHSEMPGAAGGNGQGYSVSAFYDRAWAEGRRALSVLGQVDSVDPVDLDGDGFTEVTRRQLSSYALRYQGTVWDGAGRLSLGGNLTNADRRGGDLLRIDLPADQSALTEEISTDRLGGSVGWLHAASSRFDYRISASFADTTRDSYYGGGFDPDAYGTTTNPLLAFDTQASHHHERGTVKWGVQAGRDEIDDSQPGYGRSVKATYETLGFFGQEERRFGDHVEVLYGLRVDQHSELESAVVSPRLAMLWSPRPEWVIRTSFARGLRPPMVFDEDLHIELLGGAEGRVIENADDLREERSTAYLLSAEWRPSLGSRANAVVEANLFHIGLEDLFHVRDADDPSTPTFESLRVNFGHAKVEGVEVVAAMRLGSRLSVEASFTRQTARFEQPEPDFGSSAFFRTPERYGQITLDLDLPKAVEIFLGVRYTGTMAAPHYAGFIAEDRLEQTPSFLTADLAVSRAFELPTGQTLKASLAIRNLGDAFQEDLDQGPNRDSAYVYGPRYPRMISFGLQWER